MNCQIVFANDDMGTACLKAAVAECSDCGTAICSDCRAEYCGQSFCSVCIDFHLSQECVRKPVQNERPFPSGAFGSA
jgi:hypothetical protein